MRAWFLAVVPSVLSAGAASLDAYAVEAHSWVAWIIATVVVALLVGVLAGMLPVRRDV